MTQSPGESRLVPPLATKGGSVPAIAAIRCIPPRQGAARFHVNPCRSQGGHAGHSAHPPSSVTPLPGFHWSSVQVSVTEHGGAPSFRAAFAPVMLRTMHFSPSTLGIALTVLTGIVLVAVLETSEHQAPPQHIAAGNSRVRSGARTKSADDSLEPTTAKRQRRNHEEVAVQLGMNYELAEKVLLKMGAIDRSEAFSDEPVKRMIITEEMFPDFMKGLKNAGEGLTLAELNQRLSAQADAHNLPRFAKIGFWRLDSESYIEIYSRGEIENQLVVTWMSVFPAEVANDKLRRLKESRRFTRLWWLDGHAAWEGVTNQDLPNK